MFFLIQSQVLLLLVLVGIALADQGGGGWGRSKGGGGFSIKKIIRRKLQAIRSVFGGGGNRGWKKASKPKGWGNSNSESSGGWGKGSSSSSSGGWGQDNGG